MNKAVVFDLDGTLIDSLPDIADGINDMLKKFGYPERTSEEIKNFIGNGARKLVERSLGENVSSQEVDKCLAYYNDVYTASGSPKTGLFDGVADVLIELKKRGYKLAILTNKPQITTNDVYKRYLKNFDFDKVVGQSETVKCKPDKEAVLSILREMEIEPKNAVFVGDGETDVQLSINAQISGISVLWGYRSKSFLEEYGAKQFALLPSDLLGMIN